MPPAIDPLDLDFEHLLDRLPQMRSAPRLVAAVSGGSDSVALVQLLSRARARAVLAAEIVVAHVNHRWRGAESDGDQEFVRELCRELGLDFHVRALERVPVAERREALAREGRLRALAEIASATGSRHILLGHTRDDQIETVALRLLRDSGILGLRALLPVRPLPLPAADLAARPLLVRPLLGFARTELRDYLARCGRSFRDDRSNEDLRHARNDLRHRVLPQWRAGVPDLDATLLELSRRARRVTRAAAAQARALRMETPAPWDGVAFARAATPRRAPRSCSRRRSWRWRAGGRSRARRCSRSTAGSRSRDRTRLPCAVRSAPCGATARSGSARRSSWVSPPHCRCRARCAASAGRAPSAPRWCPAPASPTRSLARAPTAASRCSIARRSYRRSWCERSRRASTCDLLGAPGSRPVRKVLADGGIAPAFRSSWPLVADREGVIWIPEVGIAERCKIVAASHGAIELRWQPPRDHFSA